MKIGFFQFSPAFGAVKRNLDKIAEATISAKADLLVFPELANTGYLFVNQHEVDELAEPIPGPSTDFLCKLAAQQRCHIIMGIAERARSKNFNSAVLAGPDGVIGVYRKAHLFDEEKLYFDPGDSGFPVFEMMGTKIGMLICFDHLFGESARTLALQGAEIICYPSNLVLPTYGQLTTRVRAIENRIFTILANRSGAEDRATKKLSYTGSSQIVAPDGQVLVQAPADGEFLGMAEIDPTKARDKRVTAHNDLFQDRRNDLYKI